MSRGIIRGFDALGRITIPIEWRRLLKADRFEISLTDKGVLLTPITKYKEKICPTCGKEIDTDIWKEYNLNKGV